MPFDSVSSATGDKVTLRDDIDDINSLPLFEESHFIQSPEADVSRGGDARVGKEADAGMRTYDEVNRDPVTEADVSRGGEPKYYPVPGPAYYWYPPHGYAGFPVGYYGWPAVDTTRNIPEGTTPLKEEADVISSDGEHVGDVGRLFVEPDKNRVTHFTISQGLLFRDQKLVPAHWVKSVEEDKVHLSVSSEFLRGLPSHED